MKEKIAKSPNDVKLHVKLIEQYLKCGNLDDALTHIVSPCTFQLYETGDDWHEIVTKFLMEYKEEKSIDENWIYWLGEVMNHERWLFLKLLDTASLEEIIETLFYLDNAMGKFTQSCFFISEANALEWVGEMVTHLRAQLCLNYALVIIKVGKDIDYSWPLLLLAFSFRYIKNIDQPSWTQDSSREILKYIQNQGYVRVYHINNISIGLMKALNPDCQSISNRISTITAAPGWRSTVYNAIFNSTERIDESYLVQNQIFDTPTDGWYDVNLLVEMVEPHETNLLNEIATKPNNIGSFVQLAAYYLRKGDIQQAFAFISRTEMKSNRIFFDSDDWYTVVLLVLEEFQKKYQDTIGENWLYWFLLINAIERRLACLPGNTELLLKLDQHLFTANRCVFQECDRNLACEFLKYFQGQFYLHAALTLLDDKQDDNTKASLALLFLACQTSNQFESIEQLENATEAKMKLFKLYATQSKIRIHQAEQLLKTYVEFTSEVQTIVADSDWKKNLYYALFGRKYSSRTRKSHMVQQMKTPTIELSDIEQQSTEIDENQQEIAIVEPSGTEQDLQYTEFETESHDKTMEIDENQISMCKLCGNTYSNTSNLNAHIETAHNLRRYLCPHCPEYLTTQNSVRRHSQKIHPGMEIPNDIAPVSMNELSSNEDIDVKICNLELKIAEINDEIKMYNDLLRNE